MSPTERGDDNPSPDNTAIPLQRAELKEREGNVYPVSLVQQIFSDHEALNLLWQGFKSSSQEDGVYGALKAPTSVTKSNSIPKRSSLTRQLIPRQLKGQEGRKAALAR